MSNWRNRFGSLFLAHRRQLESVVRKRVGSSETAADIVQDVFARALVAGPRATADDDRRVLFASARNAAVEHHRTERRRDRLLSAFLPAQLAVHEPSPERGLEAKQALGALDAALAALSPRCRDIFILRRVHGLSNEEIARWHGLSPDRLLLVGVALATAFSAFAAVLLTSGDPRSAMLLAWLSGSTYRATLPGALTAAIAAVTIIAAVGATARWLAILPLGGITAASIGVPARTSRLVVLSAIAALTAVATIAIGPLSFVGLMAPHLVRLAGIERPLEQLAAAAATGGTLLLAADWLGRNLFFPWEVPAGLIAALVGAPVCLALLRRRAA